MAQNFRLEAYGDKAHHAGLAIPVFALRSEQSSGIGQFTDLKALAEFAQTSGMDVIQLLPVNDTSTFLDWRDSYPYRAISVFALHPIYLDLFQYPKAYTGIQLAKLKQESEKLNELAESDYEAAYELKMTYARYVFDSLGPELQISKAYQEFYYQRKDWLRPYACFCYLRDKHHTAAFKDWTEFSVYEDCVYDKLVADEAVAAELDFYIFIQYLLHEQLLDAVNYAHSLGVAIKGDIAIGIAHDSVDAWTNPDLFNLDKQAGAPPDVFSTTGQNWGFPTYNWEAMAETGYKWWKDRMQAMSVYFDAYRLDHILGFFRIWEIPGDAVRGLLGQFSPAVALSAEEIENNYGIPLRAWSVERFSEPFIKDWVVDELFGRDNRDYVLGEFLDYVGDGNYRIKEAYNTQKKVEASNIEDWQKNSLYALIENVIFVKDRNNEYLYHPRINLTHTTSFREFGDEFKQKLERLYNDYFYGRNYDFWKERAYEKLPAITEATDMLACGEDLGMVPDNVPDVMWDLKILRLILERMPSDDKLVSDLYWAPYLSVLTTSSHDTSTLRGWWEENHDFTQRYYNEIMGWGGEAPQFASTEIIENIIYRHLNADSMLVILPIQDWLALDGELRRENPHDERINQPENPFHYWKYRLHLNIEELRDNVHFTNHLRYMIENSRRNG